MNSNYLKTTNSQKSNQTTTIKLGQVNNEKKKEKSINYS